MDNNPDQTQPIGDRTIRSDFQSNSPQTNFTQQGHFVQMNSPANKIRPMEQATPMIAQKKKKKSLLIGIIVAGIILLAGCIAAAIVIPNINKKDPVAAAINKILDGNAPENVAIDGDIEITANNKYSPITNLKISLNSGIIPSSMINNSIAKITASVRSVGDFTVEIDETYASDGDLYFKIDGATSALEDSDILYLLNVTNKLPQEVDCEPDDQCQYVDQGEAKCENSDGCEALDTGNTEVLSWRGQDLTEGSAAKSITSMVDAIELIDGEWLRISTEDFNNITGNTIDESEAGCIVNLVNEVNIHSNSVADLYYKYPFIKSTKDGVNISSKQYPVYMVGIDDDNFANFVNSIKNSTLSQKIYSCLNLEDSIWMDRNDAQKALGDIPPVYVEVNENDDFTRLYLQSSIGGGDATMTMDLNFSYPSSISVPEPPEYKDYSDFIEEFSTSVYDKEIDNSQ